MPDDKRKQKLPRMDDYNNMSDTELLSHIREMRSTKMRDEAKVRGGDPGRSGQMRETRKSIARAMTVLAKRRRVG